MTALQYRILIGVSSFCLACVIALILLTLVNVGIRNDIAKQQQPVQQAQVIQRGSQVLLQEIAAASPRNPEFIDLLERHGFNLNPPQNSQPTP